MLPKFYHRCLEQLLTPRQYATLRILISLLQTYRTIQIEKLAAILPIPIKYQSRRRHLQRFLVIPQLTAKCIWFPIIKKWLKKYQTRKRICYIAIDRTRWQERNLFVASIVKSKRAIPLNWMLLDKKGNSNIDIGEQKRLLKSTLRLLKGYQIIVIGDREFGNINLADWLSRQGCHYVLRTKSNKYIQQNGKDYQQLSSLNSKRGKSWYLKQVRFTKQPNLMPVNLAFYRSRNTQGKKQNEGWYLINNLSSLKLTISAYKKRMGIEALFKDCKSGGYNLEKCQGNSQRLLSLILVVAIAYTCAVIKGKKIALKGFKKYVCRLTENQRQAKRHSNFWIGLYGSLWVENFQMCHSWVERLMILTPNKLPFYQQGIRAKSLLSHSFDYVVTP